MNHLEGLDRALADLRVLVTDVDAAALSEAGPLEPNKWYVYSFGAVTGKPEIIDGPFDAEREAEKAAAEAEGRSGFDRDATDMYRDLDLDEPTVKVGQGKKITEAGQLAEAGSDKDFERVNDPSDVPELLKRAGQYLGSLGTGQAATYGDPSTGPVWIALSQLLAGTANEAERIVKRIKR